MATAEERRAQKRTLKGNVASRYATIQAAESVVQDTIKEAAQDIAALVKAHGPGPHRFKGSDGRPFWLSFRKNGDAFGIKRSDDDEDEDEDEGSEAN
jgi:hypothetical protein